MSNPNISESNSHYVLIRYSGKIYKVEKAPFENEERANDRAWYIAMYTPSNMHWQERVSRSHIWAYKKYDNMEFTEGSI